MSALYYTILRRSTRKIQREVWCFFVFFWGGGVAVVISDLFISKVKEYRSIVVKIDPINDKAEDDDVVYISN